MILIDTSVWIDFFADRSLEHVDKLSQFLEDGGKMKHSEKAVNLYNLGVAATYNGNEVQAEKYFQKAIDIAPDYYEAYYNLGNTKLALSKPHEAIKCYEKAISINPGIAPFHFMLGTAWGVVGDSLKSYKATVRGLHLEPNDPKGQSNAGRAAFFSGAFWDASLRFMVAININDLDMLAIINLGISLGRYMKLFDWELHNPGESLDLNDIYYYAKSALSLWALNIDNELANNLARINESDPGLYEKIKNAIENSDLRDKLDKDAQLAMTDPYFVGIEITEL